MLLNYLNKTLIFFIIFYVQHTSASLAHNNVFKMPNQNPYFTGRTQEIKQLNEYLKKHQVVEIVGIGGIGKTEIAKQYAHLYKEHYSTIWFIDARKDIYLQLLELGDKLVSKGLLKKKLLIGKEQKAIKNILKVLSQQRDEFLIILDNVENQSTLQMFSDFNMKNARIIITSRNEYIVPATLKVNNFTEDESILLFKKILGNDDTQEFRSLSNLLRHYPLSIMNAASFINQNKNSISVAEYIALYKNRKEHLSKIQYNTNDIGDIYNETVTQIMNKTLGTIKAESDVAYKILRVCALLDNKSISKNLLKSILTRDDEKFYEALSILHNYSIITLEHSNPDTGDMFYNIHDNVQEFIEANTDATKDKKLIEKVQSKIIGLLPEGIDHSAEFLKTHSELLLSIKKILLLSEKMPHKSDSFFDLYCRYMEYYLSGRRDFTEGEKLIQKIGANISDCKNDYIKARYKAMVSNLYTWKYSDYDKSNNTAIESLSILKKSNNKSQLNLQLYNRLIQNNVGLGDLASAEPYIYKANEFLNQKDTIPELEEVYYHAKSRFFLDKGNVEEALESSQKALKHILQKQDFIEGDLPLYLRYIDALDKIGQTNEAYNKIQTLYQQYHPYLGDNNIITIGMLIIIADTQQKKGALNQAKQNIQKAISLLEGLFNNKPTRHKANCYRILGDIYSNQNKPVQAREYYLKSESIYKAVLKHIKIDDVSLIFERLAINSTKLNNFSQTKYYLNLHKKHFGTNHPRTFGIINYLHKNNCKVP